jgi:broad-specificity NMP kinase
VCCHIATPAVDRASFAIVAGVLLLVTGASGVGKSTVRAVISPELSPAVECVELLDLTSRPATMTRLWRQQTAELVVRRAVDLQAVGRHLLLAGDPVPAAEVIAVPSAPALEAIAVCLLDATAEAQAERLAARGDPPELFPHHQAFAEWMRRQAIDPLHMTHVVSDESWEEMRWERLEQVAHGWRVHTIDTTHMTVRAVAGAVLDWCWRALGGDAPAIRVDAAGS